MAATAVTSRRWTSCQTTPVSFPWAAGTAASCSGPCCERRARASPPRRTVASERFVGRSARRRRPRPLGCLPPKFRPCFLTYRESQGVPKRSEKA
uniref:Uncharacterized protein n=1 Tax=Ixodes ricinus TaxID=34613 RepID=A0A6B0UCT2_IXORI